MKNTIISSEQFNKLLLESLFEGDSDDEDDKICLITGEKLTKDHIKLICGHKFNYMSIFNEITNQKLHTKLETHQLKKYQIKCPYCRTIQNGIIPYNANCTTIKKNGVNWPPKKVCKNEKCCTILKSGKRKGETCGRTCFSSLCSIHQRQAEAKQIKESKKIIICCTAILKSGKRKGQVCNCKCKTPELQALKVCKRHYKK